MWLVQCFIVEEGKLVAILVTLIEIKEVLEGFKKTKSPGRNGWTMEFFLHFFELMR